MGGAIAGPGGGVDGSVVPIVKKAPKVVGNQLAGRGDRPAGATPVLRCSPPLRRHAVGMCAEKSAVICWAVSRLGRAVEFRLEMVFEWEKRVWFVFARFTIGVSGHVNRRRLLADVNLHDYGLCSVDVMLE